MKRIVIVGAGYAGVLTAKKLEKRLKREKDIEITIIDKNPFHTMLTELHEVAAGRVDEDSIKIDLNRIFSGRRVNVRLDTVTSIDFKGKTVKGERSEYGYDYLVLCSGSKPTFFGVHGASEHSFTLWSYEDAVLLHEHILNMFRKAVREPDKSVRKKLLSFYVIGAGFTGVETAGELAEYVPILCEKFDIPSDEVSIYLVDTLDRVVSNLPEKLSAKVEKRLKKMGVGVILNTPLCGMGEGHIELREGDVCVRYNTDTVIWTAGIESSDIAGFAAGELKSGGRGRIQVDSYLRSVDDKSVYVAGDNMYFIPEGQNEPVPQMVENCEQSAETVAHNITAELKGHELKEYKPVFHGIMVSIGGRYGVAHVGSPGRMFSLPSFFAMFVKHFINVVYFVQVSGWNKVIGYLKHEVFTIRHRRSFVGGHFSNRTPSFLLVPLRVWLGAVWLFEGIKKITEGWLGSPKLTAFFGGANKWYSAILDGAGMDVSGSATAQLAADATTSATGQGAAAAEAAGSLIMNFDIFGLIRFLLVSGKQAAESTLNDFALKFDIPILNKLIDNIIIPNDGLQVFMQTMIVIAEILIGLALIGGLFTTPAAAFSLFLQAMFITTTGLYLGTFWMVFAAVAVLICGGRIFGLDYYVMPYLKKRWKKLRAVKRLYIYND
ncbi:MAG: FAD-dependent oxidoreductase [Clostridiales bacterium]|nr:FAD-dependent oxidoreductase [Clostridiales bacterium]